MSSARVIVYLRAKKCLYTGPTQHADVYLLCRRIRMNATARADEVTLAKCVARARV